MTGTAARPQPAPRLLPTVAIAPFERRAPGPREGWSVALRYCIYAVEAVMLGREIRMWAGA